VQCDWCKTALHGEYVRAQSGRCYCPDCWPDVSGRLELERKRADAVVEAEDPPDIRTGEDYWDAVWYGHRS